MKKLLLIALLIIGCEKDSPTGGGDVHPLVGTWECIQVTTSSESTSVTLTADDDDFLHRTTTFNGDGTYSNVSEIQGNNYSATGTWSTADNYLTYIIDGNGGGAIKGYSISNGILTITWSIYDLGTGTTRTDVETWHKQ